jgi:hypothetical protein
MSLPELIDACGTDAGYQRHRRHGEQPCYPCLQAQARRNAERKGSEYTGPQIPDPRRTRNGLPEFRPYVYRGTGADILTGCTGSYAHGCRCEDCREQHTRRMARFRASQAGRSLQEAS